jgi:hypothetical protein
VYVGDCADILADDVPQPSAAFSFQCLHNDEDVDTCRYSLQADDRDLDYQRDRSCASALSFNTQTVTFSASSDVVDERAESILLLPFHCGCHDVLHAAHLAVSLLLDIQRRSGKHPTTFFAFNCPNSDSISLLSARIDMQLRDVNPHADGHAAPYAFLSGYCDWNARGPDLPECNSPVNGVSGSCDRRGARDHQNVLALVFDSGILQHLSPRCLLAVTPKLLLSPPNGSIIYCDVPFSLQFSWLHHSALQPQAHSHRFDAGLLDFTSSYLTGSAAFRLQLSGEAALVVFKCSDIVPGAPLMITVEADFESFSSADDTDGDSYKILYTLATPCALPLALMPLHIRSALHDAAIFTWLDSNSSTQPPYLQVRCNPVNLSFIYPLRSAKSAQNATRVSERQQRCPVV